MTCPICKDSPAPFGPGSDARKCAFHGSETFLPSNWNCGTMSLLRDIVVLEHHENESPRDHNSYGAAVWNNEETCALVALPDENEHTEWIVLGWYKRRGRVAWAHIVEAENGERRELRYQDARQVILARAVALARAFDESMPEMAELKRETALLVAMETVL